MMNDDGKENERTSTDTVDSAAADSVKLAAVDGGGMADYGSGDSGVPDRGSIGSTPSVQERPQEELKCLQCAAFDQKTKTMMRELFGQDEVSRIISLIMIQIQVIEHQKRKIDRNDIKHRLMMQADVDFYSRVLGKLLISLEPKERTTLAANLASVGMGFKVTHQPCTHKAEPPRAS